MRGRGPGALGLRPRGRPPQGGLRAREAGPAGPRSARKSPRKAQKSPKRARKEPKFRQGLDLNPTLPCIIDINSFGRSMTDGKS